MKGHGGGVVEKSSAHLDVAVEKMGVGEGEHNFLHLESYTLQYLRILSVALSKRVSNYRKEYYDGFVEVPYENTFEIRIRIRRRRIILPPTATSTTAPA